MADTGAGSPKASRLLSWPIGPLKGDVYTHNGKYWVFDGCMWVSTCCPGLCSIYKKGIVLGVTIPRPFPGTGETPYTVKACMHYQELTGSWISDATDAEGGSFVTITKKDDGLWAVNTVVNGIPEQIGIIESSEPIGSWTSSLRNVLLDTVCGCINPICACFYNEVTDPIVCVFSTNYFPVSFTGINGDTDAWYDISNGDGMIYNSSSSKWELYSSSDALLYTIATTENPPIGTWEVVDGKWTYLTTSLGDCDTCIPAIDGLIFVFYDKKSGIVTYIPLTWDSLSQYFVSSDGTIIIYEDPIGSEFWTLTINGFNQGGFDNHTPVGSWGRGITVLCGNTSIANAEGCLTATGTESQVLYLQENQEGEFLYGNPYIFLWQIVCSAGTWYIKYYDDTLGSWVTYASAAGSCSTPPFSLTWTVDPSSPFTSFSFVSGPCP